MILDDVSNKKHNNFTKVKCEDCDTEREVRVGDALKCFNRSGKNLCGRCSHLGKNNSMYGVKRPEQIGNKNPMKRPEVFQRYMDNHGFRGKHHTEENKKKHSERMSGESSPWWGRKHSSETKKKMSQNCAMKRPEVAAKHSGINSHFYKPPEERISPINKALREIVRYNEWRGRVFQRDNRKCVCCGSSDTIQADHIVPFSFLLKENNIKTIEDALVCDALWSIDNGRTLCEKCHKNTDTYGIKAKKYGEIKNG